MSVCTCLFAETVIIETKLPNPITEVVISEFSQNNTYEIKTFKQINGKDTIKSSMMHNQLVIMNIR